MLPTNVMSFMKKMVAPEDVPPHGNAESSGTFGKLKQTLSSSLLTAQDRVNKMSPRPSLVPDVDSANESNQQQVIKPDIPKPVGRSGSCRICLKAFKPNEFNKTCVECDQKVCEDCASYSKLEQNEVAESWRCSVCRRKMASRIFLPQESTDSILEIPVLESLQRRHSDVKLGSTQCLGVSNGTALAPPRSPELRRHSDVSPASLKELEKLKGANASDTDWKKGHSAAPSRSSSPPRRMELETAASRIASRRPSMRMSRQRSYDDDIKSVNNEPNKIEPSLGLPAPMPRRKSAYDVYAPGVLTSAIQNAQLKEPDASGSRRPSFKTPVADNNLDNEECPSPDHINQSILTFDEDRRPKRRGSQLPDISALRGNQNPNQIQMPVYQCPALEDLEAPRRQTSLDGEAIKIVIHDVDSGPLCASKRRVILQKDPADKAHRTRGFGMRVVGGKTGADGRLFAYIVWTVPGGPAEKGGLQQGDKILEWCGTSLVDRSFEEVCAIMDRTGEVIELLVEHASDLQIGFDMMEDGAPGPNNQMKFNSEMSNLGFVSENESAADKSPSSPTRRKLPKTPEQLAREKQVSGRVQIQVWYHGDRNELVVSLMAADDLPPRDECLGYGGFPEAYASINIMPKTNETMQTEVSSPSCNPIWNATITFRGITSDTLFDRYIEVTLYDLLPQSEPIFLGECNVKLQKAFLDDVAVWYRLEDPKQMRGAPTSKMNWSSPRNSISGDVTKLIRGSDYRFQRSVSDDVDSIGDGSSLLHPDHAWAFSRRGSSQSETLEIETYQLGKDFSKSLPGSRRSSFQDQEKCKSGEIGQLFGHSRERRRSSVAKRNSDELRRVFNQSRGEFIRTMSLSRELERKQTKKSFNQSLSERNSEQIERMISNIRVKSDSTKELQVDINTSLYISSLGPGQILPKGILCNLRCVGELHIAVSLEKAVLELKVLAARNLIPDDTEATPDTYVKCYLKDGDRLRHKKKTRVVKYSLEPQYNQVLKYAASELFGRTILATVWQKSTGFEHNQSIGGAELFFNTYKMKAPVEGWYPLFPSHHILSNPNDSP